MADVSLRFLGTGGGRFATIYQARATGGCLMEAGTRIHIDPGPGALVRYRQEGLDPTDTRAVFVTHAHPDHYTDAEYCVQAMTRGGTVKRGTVVGSKSVIDGSPTHDAVFSKYHKDMPEHLLAVSPGDHVKVGGVSVRATPSKHLDETTVGFRFTTTEGVIGYIADTEATPEVVAAHRGSRVLVLPATRPRGKRIAWHLQTEDVAQIVAAVRPEFAILNHLGLKMIRHGPEKEAAWVEERTNVRTVAAFDGMRVHIGNTVEATRLAAKVDVERLPDVGDAPE